jgi:ParB family chromosome partitioning protein
VQERADHVAEWIRLTEERKEEKLVQDAPKSKTETNPKGSGRPESGINAATRELGIERTEAQRAMKIASIPQEARDAADEAGLNTQKARLEIAKAPDPVAKVRELAERKPDRDARRMDGVLDGGMETRISTLA